MVNGSTRRPRGIKKGYYIRPTVFSEVNNDMTIAREEIFGPVLTMIPYDSEEEAIRIANDTPYGLAGYVQGEDLDHAREVASKIRAGNVHINGKWGGMQPSSGADIWLLMLSHGAANYADGRHLARQLLTPEDPLAGMPHLGNDVDGQGFIPVALTVHIVD